VNREDFAPVHYTMLEKGKVYHFYSRSLGRCHLKFLGGDRFQIASGWLQSPADKKKKWVEGDVLPLPSWNVGTFYEMPLIGEVAE
jgi:hypothetical protein